MKLRTHLGKIRRERTRMERELQRTKRLAVLTEGEPRLERELRDLITDFETAIASLDADAAQWRAHLRDRAARRTVAQ
jgi:hypothetical protein